jgi:F0F1-type ATP synthase assembly protein I
MDVVNLGLSITSMLVGGFLGWLLASKRNRNPIGWMVAGVIFPPLVLILLFMKPAAQADVAAPETDETTSSQQ